MKLRIILSAVFFVILFNVAAQEMDLQAENSNSQNGRDYFLLLPILETAFSARLEWRPNWPLDIPPDAFFTVDENTLTLEISNQDANLNVRRNGEGRLSAFPLFFENEIAMAEAVYAQTGALENLTVVFINAGNGSEVEAWEIEFPAGFLPYSDLSPGGSFAPIKATRGGEIFHVFIFESPSFVTETWYNNYGELLIFCKALVRHDNGRWRIRSLQIHDSNGTRFEDYFFDSFGNISEVRLGGRVFSALYRGRLPVYWRRDDVQWDLQWDARGLLTVKKAEHIEYRYEYELDIAGNWISRQERALVQINTLLVPQPVFSRGIWSRRIEN